MCETFKNLLSGISSKCLQFVFNVQNDLLNPLLCKHHNKFNDKHLEAPKALFKFLIEWSLSYSIVNGGKKLHTMEETLVTPVVGTTVEQ